MVEKSKRLKLAIITSCSKNKLEHPAKAKDLNKGQFTQSVRKFSDKMGADLYIMSGKHGLISGDQVIEPYNQKMKTKADVERLKKTVDPQMPILTTHNDTVALIMGGGYQRAFKSHLDHPKVIHTEDHRGSGGYLQIASKLNELPKEKAWALIKKTMKSKNKAITVETIDQIRQAEMPTSRPTIKPKPQLKRRAKRPKPVKHRVLDFFFKRGNSHK